MYLSLSLLRRQRPQRGEKDLRDFLDMVSLRILAKESDTAPSGAVSELLAKDAERLLYKIRKDFLTSVNKWEPLSSFDRATISRRDLDEILHALLAFFFSNLLREKVSKKRGLICPRNSASKSA